MCNILRHHVGSKLRDRLTVPEPQAPQSYALTNKPSLTRNYIRRNLHLLFEQLIANETKTNSVLQSYRHLISTIFLASVKLGVLI